VYTFTKTFEIQKIQSTNTMFVLYMW